MVIWPRRLGDLGGAGESLGNFCHNCYLCPVHPHQEDLRPSATENENCLHGYALASEPKACANAAVACSFAVARWRMDDALMRSFLDDLAHSWWSVELPGVRPPWSAACDILSLRLAAASAGTRLGYSGLFMPCLVCRVRRKFACRAFPCRVA